MIEIVYMGRTNFILDYNVDPDLKDDMDQQEGIMNQLYALCMGWA